MKIKDISAEERPRERLMKLGPKALGNAELLAILLRQGSRNENVLQLSHKILQKYDLKKLSRIKPNTLQKILGIGVAKACQISACFELARRLSAFSSGRKRQVTSAKDIVKLFMPELSTLQKEHLIGIYLDSRKSIIKEETIFIGTLNTSIIHPREIFQIAISEGAAAIILLHNHPSGDPAPSDQDTEITRQLIEAGKLLDIEILDHIIIGYKRYFSFREKCMI